MTSCAPEDNAVTTAVLHVTQLKGLCEVTARLSCQALTSAKPSGFDLSRADEYKQEQVSIFMVMRSFVVRWLR